MENKDIPKYTSNIKPMLIVILILELLGLYPWFILTALSLMGFERGYSWDIVLVMSPFWSYPLLIIICGIFAFTFNRKSREGAAILTIIIPPIFSFGYLIMLPLIFGVLRA